MKRILFALFLLLSHVGFAQCLSGIYTIGGTTPDYATIQTAVNDLVQKGVCGAVDFKIRKGIYDEKITIPKIPGASASNLVTWESEDGDKRNVTIQFTPTTRWEHVLSLDSTSYMQFKNLRFKSISAGSFTGTFRRIVYLKNQNTHISFDGIDFIAPTNTSRFGSSEQTLFFVESNVKHLRISNCYFESGYNAIANVKQHNALPDSAWVIEKNVFDFQSQNCFSIRNIYDCLIQNNELRGTRVNALEMNNIDLLNLNSNLIYTHSQMQMINIGGGQGQLSTISNNHLVGIEDTLNTNGILEVRQSTDLLIANNNFISTSRGINSRSLFFLSQSSRIEFKNNILASPLAENIQYLRFYEVDVDSVDFDYNNYGRSPLNTSVALNYVFNNVIYNHSSLASFQQATNLEMHAQTTLPKFVSWLMPRIIASDPQNQALDGTGEVLAAVQIDYEGGTRNATRPDIGADEFYSQSTCQDVGAVLFDTQASMCEGKYELMVGAVNYDTAALTDVRFHMWVNGEYLGAKNYYGQVLPGDSSSPQAFQVFDFVAGTAYDIKVTTDTPNGLIDINPVNDTFRFQVQTYPKMPSAIPNGLNLCHNDSLFLDPGAGFSSFQYMDSSLQADQGWVKVPGTYHIQLTDANQCERIQRIWIDVEWEIKRDGWITDGNVWDMLSKGDSLIVGGSFDYIGKRNLGFGGYNHVTKKQLHTPFLNEEAIINSITSDGNGGWYIAGEFAAIGGIACQNLAHILADGSVEDWTPLVNGNIAKIALHDERLFIAGEFDSVGLDERRGIAEIHTTTGRATNWNCDLWGAGTVSDFEFVDSLVYMCGNFKSNQGAGLSSVSNYLMAVHVEDARRSLAVINGHAKTSQLVKGDSLMYCSQGNFAHYLKAFNIQTGRWSPNWQFFLNSSEPNDMIVKDSFLCVGGSFPPILQIFNTAQAAPIPNVPIVNGQILTFHVGDSSVFIGGNFSEINNDVFKNGGELLLPSTQMSDWRVNTIEKNLGFAPFNEDIHTLIVNDSLAWGGGSFQAFGTQRRQNIAILDLAEEKLGDWQPNTDADVIKLAIDEDKLYIGGTFHEVEGRRRDAVASFELGTWSLSSWSPNPSIQGISTGQRVDVISLTDDRIYIGGSFDRLLGRTQRNVAAFSKADGSLISSFNPNFSAFSNEVTSIAPWDSVVFIGKEDALSIRAYDTLDGSFLYRHPRFNFSDYINKYQIHRDHLWILFENKLPDHILPYQLNPPDFTNYYISLQHESPFANASDVRFFGDLATITGRFDSLNHQEAAGFALFSLIDSSFSPLVKHPDMEANWPRAFTHIHQGRFFASHGYTGTYNLPYSPLFKSGLMEFNSSCLPPFPFFVNQLDLGPDTTICGNSIQLDAGGNFKSYRWSTGDTTSAITVTQSGTYTVTVTDLANQQKTDQRTIIIDNVPDPNFSYQQQAGNQIDFSSANSASTSHLWDFGDGNTSTSNNPSHTYASTGSYTVKLVISNACGSDSSTVVIMLTELAETHPLEQVQIFPNPNDGIFYIKRNFAFDREVSLELVNQLGQQVWQGKLKQNEQKIDGGALKAGVYLLIIDHQVSKKVVIF